MKKLVPNQLINQPVNLLLPKNSLNLMMKSVLILMFMLFATNISAQNLTARSSGIMEVQAFLSALRGSNASSRSAQSEADHLERLINDKQPAVYFDASGARNYGENPTSLYTNPASLSNLAQASFDKGSIEIVTIRIVTNADKNGMIDLSVFSDFPKLKYVYILSDIKTTSEAIRQSIKGASPTLGIFYKIEIGS